MSDQKSNLQLVSRRTVAKEWTLAAVFFACAFVAVLGVALIFLFVGWRSLPIFAKVGLDGFLFSSVWAPLDGSFGIAALLAGSIIVTVGALALGTPLAVGTAVFLSEIASPRVRAIHRAAETAARRRGSSMIIRPFSGGNKGRSARGARVVLPEPGGALRTTEGPEANAFRRNGRMGSMG